MRIIPNNLQRQYEMHACEYEEKALHILRKGWYVLGDEVAAFEREFASYTGVAYCVGVANGLDALWISMRLMGIGAGDEVIIAANAYIACVMSITINGATPVFVEPDIYNNIDPERIEAVITRKTKAVMPVHLFGQSCDMETIMEIAGRHGLMVIEDCAQSHGTMWKGRMTGSFGDAGCFSFYPTKGLGAFGDAGAIVTNDPALADKVRVFRNYGSRERYKNEIIGTNSRLDELQAGLLRIRLRHLDELNKEREKIAKSYAESITNSLIELPKIRPGSTSTWHQFTIRISVRDKLVKWLEENGIGSIIHYPIPPYLSESYAYLGFKVGDFPITEKYAAEILSLPMYNSMTNEELNYITEKVNEFEG